MSPTAQMSKTVIIWSSANEDGLTAAAKNAFIDGLKEAGDEYEEIWLNRKDLHHCMACGNGYGMCGDEGSCVIKDDFAEIYQEIRPFLDADDAEGAERRPLRRKPQTRSPLIRAIPPIPRNLPADPEKDL